MKRIEHQGGILRVPLYQIDAFSDCVFGGNPAAVCVLPAWLHDDLMQKIAAENNLSETAFIVRHSDSYGLRWFTPTHEVDLCGHATLASAFVIFMHLEPERSEVSFETRSGQLTVYRADELLTMNFPAYQLTPVLDPPAALLAGLGAQPTAVFHALKNYYVIFDHEDEIRGLQPDMDMLKQLHPNGVSVTAEGVTTDFTSRYFAPSYGIPEDPVSGHPHCALTPYWAERLGKTRLSARQLSERGGDLLCELQGDRVLISGGAAEYLVGEVYLSTVHEPFL
jgi:PhzF family phenazine biosynthesis protein